VLKQSIVGSASYDRDVSAVESNRYRRMLGIMKQRAYMIRAASPASG